LPGIAGGGTVQDADLADGSDPSPSSLRGVQVREGGEKAKTLPDTHEAPTSTGSVASEISNAVVRLHSEYTGRGPTRARTHITEELISVVLRDTLTNGERRLLADGKVDLVLAIRKAYQEAMRSDIIAAIERLSGRRVIAFLNDNHIDPDIAVESFVLEPRSDGAEPHDAEDRAA